MQIDLISSENPINPENDNADSLVRLDDGRVYGLLVATPNNIYWCMDNEACDYYFGVPPLFVKTLTRTTIEKAVAALIQEPEWLGVYGALQSTKPRAPASG
jgi:hypothetical protein